MYLNVFARPSKVKPARLRIVVPVGVDGQAGVLEDGRVVAPGGLGQVDGLVAGEPLFQVGPSNPEGSRPGNGLNGHIAALSNNTVSCRKDHWSF